MRRDVWARDSGQCTFVASTGKRCGARRGLELDHVMPVARGGEATVDNLRLRCRAHNQFTAEQAFGQGFMKAKREQTRARKAKACDTRPARPRHAAPDPPPGDHIPDEAARRLRELGLLATPEAVAPA